MSAFPPHRLGVSVPVPQETALKFISSYLTAAKTSPHLLPNARLESSGPTAGSSGSSILIHNLQRVEAGLRGEWLAPVLDLDEGNVSIAGGMEGTNKGQDVSGEAEAEGWMDLDEYQREQSIEGGEVEERLPGVADEGDSDFEDPLGGEVDHEAGTEEMGPPKAKKPKTKHENGIAKVSKVTKPKDKEARKREKKLRHKEEQRLKQAKLANHTEK